MTQPLTFFYDHQLICFPASMFRGLLDMMALFSLLLVSSSILRVLSSINHTSEGNCNSVSI